MYKLIKHSIEEHHYEHPRLAEVASGFCGNVPPPPPTVSSASLMAVNIEPSVRFRFKARHLWGDHIWYMRELLTAILNGVEPTTQLEERLLLNAVDLGDTIKPFYGETAGNRLTGLLEELNKNLIEVVKDAKNSKGVNRPLLERAFADVANIADFLDNANPSYWPKSVVQSMFIQYINLLASEISAKINKDWTTDISLSDRIKTLIMSFADAFARGLIEQFPQKFFL